MLTAERLKHVLDYDPSSGEFTWKVERGPAKVGGRAGCSKENGYLVIGVDGKLYRAHRLAWLYMTGEWPSDQVDHRNLNRSDNSWSNLRSATNTQNHQNKRMFRRNSSGLKGAERNGPGYCARIKVNGKRIYLGQFRTPHEAHQAYVSAAELYFGEFARVA